MVFQLRNLKSDNKRG